MTSQNVQQEQIKEIFKLNNLTRVKMTQNRRILKQLDVKINKLKPQCLLNTGWDR